MDEPIWMEHAHGGRALLPDMPYWRANGWEPCDGPPPEPDLTRDPQLHDQTDETPPSAGSLAVQPEEADEEELTRG